MTLLQRVILLVLLTIVTLFNGWIIVEFIFRYHQPVDTAIEAATKALQLPGGRLLTILLPLLAVCIGLAIKYLRAVFPAKSLMKLLSLQIVAAVLFALHLSEGAQNDLARLPDLIVFAATFYLLTATGNLVYDAGRDEWRHPTTLTQFLISALLAGGGLMLIVYPEVQNQTWITILLLTAIMFDLLIFLARFRFLAGATAELRALARALLGGYVIYTGVRLIAGSFIPMVYLVRGLFSSYAAPEATGLLLLTGVFLNMILMVLIPPAAIKNQN
jgi:hypothetical protein